MRKTYPQRQAFPHIGTVTTCWTDNDIYGHVNNAVYYHYFDSVINAYLVDQGGLDIQQGEVVGFIVHSACDYLGPVAYPGNLEVGIATTKVGNSSVTYQVALFKPGESAPSAVGSMVHVFVAQASNQPVAIPERLRHALQAIALRA